MQKLLIQNIIPTPDYDSPFVNKIEMQENNDFRTKRKRKNQQQLSQKIILMKIQNSTIRI